jgi:hypothetical protein
VFFTPTYYNVLFVDTHAIPMIHLSPVAEPSHFIFRMPHQTAATTRKSIPLWSLGWVGLAQVPDGV